MPRGELSRTTVLEEPGDEAMTTTEGDAVEETSVHP